MKIEGWQILAIIIIGGLVTGLITIPGFYEPDKGTGPDFNITKDSDGDGWSDSYERKIGTDPFLMDTDGDGTKDSLDPNPLKADQNLVSVTKPVKFVMIDKWNSSNSVSGNLYYYDETGKNQLEGADSLSSSAATTGNSYASGTKMWVKHYYDTTVDIYYWHKITVPKMTPADAESLSTNTVTIYTFDCAQSTSGSDSLYDTAGNSVSDAADYNFTTGNNDTTTFTYSWYMANDGEGYLTSQDPIYEIELYPVLWMELSGTGYESITLSGWDGKYERGSTMYHYKILGETEITRYKVGQDYVYPGAGSFSFSFDASGTSDNDEVLGQIYLKIYSDPQYHKDYGSYGPYAFTLFEHTVDDFFDVG